MMDVTIREYIGHKKELTAEQVRKSPVGTRVLRHSFSRRGEHQTLECWVVQIATGSDRILMICNEDGKYLPELDPNIHVSVKGWQDLIFGTVIICGDWRQDFADCPIDLDTWTMLLRKWGN